MAAQPQPKMVSVTVRYFKPGIQPPIYVAGSFSQPEWQPQEMDHTMNGDNECEFHKDVEVEAGKQHQYKFRIGPGDWWTLDEDSPTVTDNLGNRNNLLAVPAPAHGESILPQEERKPGDKPVDKETVDSATAPAPGKEDSQQLPATPERTASLPAEKMNGTAHEQSKHTMEPQPNVEEAPNGSTNTQPEGLVLAHPESSKESNDLMGTKTIKDTAGTPEDEASDDKFQSPTLIIKNEQQHVEDSGADSAIGQQDAHHLRAQDVEPDFVVTRNEAHTPDLADVAAEVADSAATLDLNEPTPSISDEEAGKIGFRRMSSTPIPEVAKTAAEVADTAALLDEERVERSYYDTSPTQIPRTGAGNITEVTNTSNSQTTPKEEVGPEPPTSTAGEGVVETPQPIEKPKIEVQEVQIDSGNGEQESRPLEPQGNNIEKAKLQVEPISETEDTSIEPHKDEKIQVPVAYSKSEHANLSLDGICPEGSHTVPSPITPFVVSNRQLGDDEHVREISTGDDGPNITVQPATPGSSTRNGLGDGTTWSEPFKKPVDTAKSSAIASENGRSQVTSRKSQRPPTPSPPDRPITPTSMRSSHKDVKSRNFLKAFWRVVFVDWIGGLILRLCGGGRRT